MTELAMLAAKVGAPLAAKAAAGGVRWATLTLQVAWQTRKSCARNHLPVPSLWRLRRFLADADVVTGVSSGHPSELRRIENAMRGAELAPGWALTDEQAAQMLRLVLAAYTRALHTNVVVELQARTVVADIKDHIDQHASRASDAEFAAALQFLSPPSASAARELRPIWGPLDRLVREYAAAPDRAQLIQDWASKRPEWLGNAPSPVLLWLADVAEEHGLSNPSGTFMRDALTAGATPVAYWALRSVLTTVPEVADQQTAALESLEGDHPARTALLAFLGGEAQDGLRHLDEWVPRSSSEVRFRDFLTVQLLIRVGEYDDAVALADACLVRGQTGPAQFVAERLLERGNPRSTPFHFAQLQLSQHLALRVRDALRAWHGPSRGAVLTAMKAAEVLGDGHRAWTLSQPAPDGEATEFEAAGSQIRERALLIAAEERSLEQAEALLREAPESAAKLQARALVADRRDDAEAAQALWREASEQVTDPSEMLRVGFQLARFGEFAQALDILSDAHPAEVAEIRALANLNAGAVGFLESLRGTAHQSRTLTFGLASYLHRSGEALQAARVAADGAERWSDGELWLVAAREFLRANAYADAAHAARAALSHDHRSGPDGLVPHLLLIEALTADGKWSEATDAAAAAMARFPAEPGAVWALVLCQLHLGRKDKAWQTYAEFGGRPAPRTAHEAAVRIRLWRDFDGTEASLAEMFTLMDEWGEHREVQLASAYALLMLPGVFSDQRQEQIRSRVGALLAALPDVFVQQHFDEENVRGSLDAMVATLPDTSEHDRQVLEGMLPFGMLASVHHRSLTELLVARSTPLFADDAAQFEAEVESAREGRTNAVVADLTALVSLTYFDGATVAQMMGFASSVTAPLRQRLDAAEALDSLGHLSTMTVGRSSDGTATVHVISDEEATSRLTRAQTAVRHFDTVRCVERTWPPRIPRIGVHLDGLLWAESLDLALSDPPCRLWIDDARVRQLAVEAGVQAFGTAALLEAMRRERMLADEEATHLRAVLVTHNYVGAQFDLKIAEAAAALDNWLPRGVASYIAWGPGDDSPQQRLQFVLDAMRRCNQDPDAVQAWTEAIAHWLVRVGGDGAGQNLVLLLQSLLAQEWVTAAQLPFVLAGVRGIATARDVPDPFEQALERHYRALRMGLEPQLASAVLRGLVRLVPDEDRATATRVIMTT